MNIDAWLEKTLNSIRSSDPKELMRKMEKYGLIEDEPGFESKPMSLNEIRRFTVSYDDVSSSIQSENISVWIDDSNEADFNATPPQAAFYYSMLNSMQYLFNNRETSDFSMCQAA